MKTIKIRLFVGICLLIIFINLIPPSYSQEMYPSYLWKASIGYPISVIRVTGDLNADFLHISEVVVAGRGALTLLDGITGFALCHYNISSAFTFNALAVGNLDADSQNEIAVGSKDGGLLSILKFDSTNQNFTLLWKKAYNITDIAISDVTGDSLNEVLISDLSGNFMAFYRNGTLYWSINLHDNLSGPIEHFMCLNFSQHNFTDRILVFGDSFIVLLNNTGEIQWQIEVNSKPLNGLLGNVLGTQDPELIVKLQKNTLCLAQNGTLLWHSNSTPYISDYPGLLLHNYTNNLYSQIFISTNNGTYSLAGINGTLIHQYPAIKAITSLAIGKFFGGTTDYLITGDIIKNITFWNLQGPIYLTANLSESSNPFCILVDLLLLDMNNNGIPDLITASSNGTVYAIGLQQFYDLTWILVGVGISIAIIIVSIYIIIKTKPKPPADFRRPLNP